MSEAIRQLLLRVADEKQLPFTWRRSRSAAADHALVADESAAPAREDWWTARVKHARYYWLLLAEGHLHRRLFSDMLRRLWALPLPAGERATG